MSARLGAARPLGRELGDAWRFGPDWKFATFDTRRVAEGRRFDVWREFNAVDASPFEARLLAESRAPGFVTIAGGAGFGVCHMSMEPHAVTRRAAEVRRGGGDTVLVLLIGSGRTVVEQNERTIPAFAGDILVIFMDVPFRLVHHDARDLDAVRLPASEFPPGLRDQTPVLLNPKLTPTASIAAGHIRWQPADLDELADASDLVRSQMIALLSFGIARPAGVPRASGNLFDAIGAAVGAEVSNPDLSAKLLCARLGVSRTTLFEALAANGTTLTTMVRDRRLLGCLRDLRRADGAETLTRISERWGYRDLSSFSRAFRHHYGIPPSRWRDVTPP